MAMTVIATCHPGLVPGSGRPCRLLRGFVDPGTRPGWQPSKWQVRHVRRIPSTCSRHNRTESGRLPAL